MHRASALTGLDFALEVPEMTRFLESQSFSRLGRSTVREPGELTRCHNCLREVPRSVATMAEGSDYVFHFCGAECFAQWYERRRHGRNPARDA